MKVLTLCFTCVLLLLLTACGESQQATTEPKLFVSAFSVDKPVNNQLRNFKGTVIPADLTPLSFRIEGELTDIYVKAGQKVKKGERLAKLDDSRLKQQLIDAKAQFELALKQFKRGQTLSKQNMISDSDLDALTAAKRIAEVAFKSAQNTLNYSQIYAPFNGYISDVPKKNFESVKAGEVILNIYRDDVVQVRIDVSDMLLAMLNPAASVSNYEVKANFAGGNHLFILKYLEHTSEPTEEGNAFKILLQMPQVTPAILPGSTANLDVDMGTIGLHEITGYQIPMTAIIAGESAGEFFVWQYRDGKVYKQNIEVMEVNSKGAMVIKGVKSGDLIIDSSLKKLRNEQAVSLIVEGQSL